MNHVIRKATKENDIYKDCDFCAIRNNNDTFYILSNRHGKNNVTADSKEFAEMLIKTKQPVVLPVDKIS